MLKECQCLLIRNCLETVVCCFFKLTAVLAKIERKIFKGKTTSVGGWGGVYAQNA